MLIKVNMNHKYLRETNGYFSKVICARSKRIIFSLQMSIYGLLWDRTSFHLSSDTKKPTQRSVSVSTSKRRDGTSGRT